MTGKYQKDTETSLSELPTGQIRDNLSIKNEKIYGKDINTNGEIQNSKSLPLHTNTKKSSKICQNQLYQNSEKVKGLQQLGQHWIKKMETLKW